MKKLTFLFLILCFGSFAQSVAPQVINSAGGSGTVGTGTAAVQVFYNIGEPVIATVSDGTNAITQGFLQPDIVGEFGLTVSSLSSNESCLSKNDGKINITLNTQPTSAVTILYKWTPSALCPNDDCSSMDSLTPGNYSVLVEAMDNSSVVLDSVRLNFVITANTDPCQISVFTAFSPNGDGLNDAWIIQDIENFPNNTVTIYSRWGNKLAFYNNYDNKSNAWKGESPSGNIVPNGTYFYVIELNNGTGYKKGWVEVTGK